ncbi:GspH/FimT family pseudopilin [Pseudomonas oryzae]|uniref:Type II secretion system protein H n=1 Tax=Pseudomonas oryzae TaxID=1392877 RepID=A0A1H1RW80_9PSED|nr:GspH/FimT family pseudopilin [Pseudomonas oryzae]SDS39935.1 general secretion pathway protein H [Pseudomonas oryzae]
MCAAGSEARGFTLMELLVVLVIAGLAVSLVGPAFQRMLPGVGLEAETRTLAAMLRHARSQAILSGAQVSISTDADTGGLRLSYRNAPYVLPEGLAVSMEGGPNGGGADGGAQILFYPRGDSSGGSITIKLKGESAEAKEGQSRVIVVDWLSGRVERSTEEEQERLKEERERIERAREKERERRKLGTGEGFSA